MWHVKIHYNDALCETLISWRMCRLSIKGKKGENLWGVPNFCILFRVLQKISCQWHTWRRYIHFEPKPSHLVKKNLFFPRGTSFSACCGAGAGEGDSKGGVTSLTARIIVNVITFIHVTWSITENICLLTN